MKDVFLSPSEAVQGWRVWAISGCELLIETSWWNAHRSGVRGGHIAGRFYKSCCLQTRKKTILLAFSNDSVKVQRGARGYCQGLSFFTRLCLFIPLYRIFLLTHDSSQNLSIFPDSIFLYNLYPIHHKILQTLFQSRTSIWLFLSPPMSQAGHSHLYVAWGWNIRSASEWNHGSYYWML